MKSKLFYLILFTPILLFGQNSSSKVAIDFSGYIDCYYSYDFDQPETKYKQPFQYNYNRQNSFNLNIALLRANINYKNVYAKISVHAGTYVEDNYATESIKYINEACVGVFLDKNKKTSLEAGILPSYIGFESATTHSNLTLTRSILAENSPYYMTGIKLNHQFNNQWSIAGLITNGWQHIEKVDASIPPAFGTQIVYKPNENNLLNWSTFIGKEFYGTDLGFRYFSNFYWDSKWHPKWHTVIGFDYGLQDVAPNGTKLVNWFSPVLINQYSIHSKWQITHRIEYYQDTQNVLLTSYNLPFKTIGNSINFDFLVNSKFKLRTEGKWYHATQNIFDENTQKDNFSVTSTLSFEF